jgi:hypothetical protein
MDTVRQQYGITNSSYEVHGRRWELGITSEWKPAMIHDIGHHEIIMDALYPPPNQAQLATLILCHLPILRLFGGQSSMGK